MTRAAIQNGWNLLTENLMIDYSFLENLLPGLLFKE